MSSKYKKKEAHSFVRAILKNNKCVVISATLNTFIVSEIAKYGRYHTKLSHFQKPQVIFSVFFFLQFYVG